MVMNASKIPITLAQTLKPAAFFLQEKVLVAALIKMLPAVRIEHIAVLMVQIDITYLITIQLYFQV